MGELLKSSANTTASDAARKAAPAGAKPPGATGPDTRQSKRNGGGPTGQTAGANAAGTALPRTQPLAATAKPAAGTQEAQADHSTSSHRPPPAHAGNAGAGVPGGGKGTKPTASGGGGKAPASTGVLSAKEAAAAIRERSNSISDEGGAAKTAQSAAVPQPPHASSRRSLSHFSPCLSRLRHAASARYDIYRYIYICVCV